MDVAHLPAWQFLRRALLRGALAHAYLFTGAAGLGQSEIASRLVQVLNCPQPPAPGEACEACVSCRLARAGQHPRALHVRPSTASIKLEQAREVARFLALTLEPNEYRVVLVEEADRLTPEAANRLLKALEEPPARTLFILMAPSPDLLPETLVSRCQQLAFHGLPEDVVAGALRAEGLSGPRSLALARLSGGNPAQARAWAERGVLDGLRRRALRGLERLIDGDVLEALAVADDWHQEEDLDDLFAMVDALLRDAMVTAAVPPVDFWNADLADDVTALAARAGASADWDAALMVTARARRALAAHVPRLLVLESCCLRLRACLLGRAHAIPVSTGA